MITIEQWRAAVGSFHPKLRNLLAEQSNKFVDSHSTFHVLTLEIMLVVMVLICNFDISFLMTMKLLVDGDVESNPGPTYNIKKLVKASFHQGNMMFGVSAGMQCACNALISICWSKIKKMAYWNSCDLDSILLKGAELFKSLNLWRYFFLSL